MSTDRTTASTLRLPARSRVVPTPHRLATRRVPAIAVPLLTVVLGGGVLVTAQATGHWATTGRDAAATAGTGSGPGAASPGSGTGGDTSTLPASPEDVKGWMTLQQVVDAGFPGVTEAGLRARFAIPATIDLSTPLKELDGTVTGFDVATLRTWLSAPG